MKRLLVTIIMFGVCGAIAWLAADVRDQPSPPRVSPPARPPAEPVRSSQRPHIADAPPTDARDHAGRQSSPVAPAGDAEPLSSEQVRDRLQGVFDTEVVDPSWSLAAADKLTRGVQGLLRSESRLERIECRATLCRIETSHRDLEAYRAYVRDVYFEHDTAIPNTGTFINVLREPKVGGPIVAVAYLAGKGDGLPSPDQLRN